MYQTGALCLCHVFEKIETPRELHDIIYFSMRSLRAGLLQIFSHTHATKKTKKICSHSVTFMMPSTSVRYR